MSPKTGLQFHLHVPGANLHLHWARAANPTALKDTKLAQILQRKEGRQVENSEDNGISQPYTLFIATRSQRQRHKEVVSLLGRRQLVMIAAENALEASE